MVDAARQMLDELMGRNRNLHPTEAVKKVNWDDSDYCQYYLVKFCPHDLFVNTRADLGPCQKLHDDEAKRLYENAKSSVRKRQYEDDFLRFCNNMINEVDRKIQKGKQRLNLMNKSEGGVQAPVIYISKYQDQLNNLNARIKKLLNEAEEAGHRGDVDQAQDLMTLCEQLKEEKDQLIAQRDNTTLNGNPLDCIKINPPSSTVINHVPIASREPVTDVTTTSERKLPIWMTDPNVIPEKQMEVCEICGAFLIVGDAQQRIEDHLMGKQHLGYSKLRTAVEEIHKRRIAEREEEEKRREERRPRETSDYSDRRRRDNYRDRRGLSRDRGSNRYDSGRHRSDRRDKYPSHHRKRSNSRSRSRRRSRDSRTRSRSRH